MREIPNEELTLDAIPVNAQDAVGQFAHSFNGYVYGETMENCGQKNKKVKQAMNSRNTSQISLSELRAGLFFYYRALRHGGTEQEDRLVEQYLTLIRERVTQNKLT